MDAAAEAAHAARLGGAAATNRAGNAPPTGEPRPANRHAAPAEGGRNAPRSRTGERRSNVGGNGVRAHARG
eukprot:13593681-Alexandrium_andersonii.AAC.1